MGRRRKLPEKLLPPETIEQDKNSYIETDLLEKQLDTFGTDIVNMMTYGAMPELITLSWEMFERFKRGEIKELEGSDKELEEFFLFKKKDLVVKLMGFVELCSNALLNSEKINAASLKDITQSLKVSLDMINTLSGASISKKVEHTHTYKIEHVHEVDEKIRKAKEELDAIEAEFTDAETDDFDL